MEELPIFIDHFLGIIEFKSEFLYSDISSSDNLVLTNINATRDLKCGEYYKFINPISSSVAIAFIL